MLFIFNSLAVGQVSRNDTFWKDTDGNPILSQGGGTIKVGEIWYWYGAKYGNAATYYNETTNSNYNGGSGTKVSCYSSKDLANWKFEGDVYTASGGWFGRLGVVYHAKTGKYVLIAQGNENRVVFASSDTPTGQFTFHSLQTPPGVANGGTGDQTVFQDDDGKAYIICSSKNGRANLYVIPLRESDYLGMETAVRIFGGVGREGNWMFEYRGRYYFNSSLLHGWNTSPTYYISATNILGPYSAEKIFANSEIDYSHVTQTGFIITVNGTEDTTVIFCGDLWSKFAGNGVGYNQWCPITFNGTDSVFNSLSRWSLDAVKGTWKVAQGNNYILNPAFEADRILTSPLVGWTGSRNVRGSPVAGNFSLELNSGSEASHRVSGLPNDVYELSAWIQGSGSQGSCRISISDFGGSEMRHSASEQMGNWTEVRIQGIRVTSGRAQVKAANSGKAWCRMDDFSLAGSGQVSSISDSHGNRLDFAHDSDAFSLPSEGRSGNTTRMEFLSIDGRSVRQCYLVPGTDPGSTGMPANHLGKGRYLLKMGTGAKSAMTK